MPETATSAYGSQKIWNTESAIVLRQFSLMIAEEFPLSEILQFLALRRRAIAIVQQTQYAEQFGRLRASMHDRLRADGYDDRDIQDFENDNDPDELRMKMSDKTPLGGRYRAAGEESRQRAEQAAIKPSDDFRPAEAPASQLGGPGLPNFKGDLRGYRSYGQASDRLLALTATLFTAIPDSKSDAIGLLVHSSYENIEPILVQATELHREVLRIVIRDVEDVDRILELLGRIAWWLGHAMPWERGSASVVEWYVEGMLDQLKLRLGRRMTPLDFPAFRLSEKEYAASFRSFFDARK